MWPEPFKEFIVQHEMTERPLVLTAPVVRSLLNGTRTHMRFPVRTSLRPLKGHWAQHHQQGIDETLSAYPDGSGNGWIFHSRKPGPDGAEWTAKQYPENEGVNPHVGIKGDRLWIKETWAWVHSWTDENGHVDQIDVLKGKPEPGRGWIHFQCDSDDREAHPSDRYIHPWRSPQHMPRWASRITLEIVGIRAHRLDDITPAEVRAEGFVKGMTPGDAPDLSATRSMINPKFMEFYHAKQAYQEWWESIHGKNSWKGWVWDVEVKQIEQKKR